MSEIIAAAVDAQTEWNHHCWQGKGAQMDIQICHRAHITQMCHILVWKVRWNIETMARKEFRNGPCLWLCCQLHCSCWYGTCTFGFVFSYHWRTAGFGRWFMNLDSQFILGEVCRRSCYLWCHIHGEKTQPMIRFLLSRSLPLCSLHTSAWEVGMEVLFWQLMHHPIPSLHVVYTGYGLTKKII